MPVSAVLELTGADLTFTPWSLRAGGVSCSVTYAETLGAHGGFTGAGAHTPIWQDDGARACVFAHAIGGSGQGLLAPDWDGPGSGCPPRIVPPVYGVNFGDGTDISYAWSSNSGTSGVTGTYGNTVSKSKHYTKLDIDASPTSWQDAAFTWTDPSGPNAAARNIFFPAGTPVVSPTAVREWEVSAVEIAVRQVAGETPAGWSVVGDDTSGAWWDLETYAIDLGEQSPWIPVSPIYTEVDIDGHQIMHYPSVTASPDVQNAFPRGNGSVSAALEYLYRFRLTWNILTVAPPLHQRQRTGGMEGHVMHHGAGISTRNNGKFSRGML